VAWLIPVAFASERVLLCVAPRCLIIDIILEFEEGRFAHGKRPVLI
jgi:hypothetical protein